jgi:hypothetical protein
VIQNNGIARYVNLSGVLQLVLQLGSQLVQHRVVSRITIAKQRIVQQL